MSNENETDNNANAKPQASDKTDAEVSPAKEVGPKADREPAAKRQAAEAPPPPEHGVYGKLLESQGFHPVPLGRDAVGIETIEVKAEELLEASRVLRDHPDARFDLLLSVSGVDWKTRLEVVYHMTSTKTFDKLAVKVTAVDDKVPSITSVWRGADWHERETYDLFGITFEGHPALRRILMPADWVGYPMRKDYQVADPRLVWNER